MNGNAALLQSRMKPFSPLETAAQSRMVYSQLLSRQALKPCRQQRTSGFRNELKSCDFFVDEALGTAVVIVNQIRA